MEAELKCVIMAPTVQCVMRVGLIRTLLLSAIMKDIIRTIVSL